MFFLSYKVIKLSSNESEVFTILIKNHNFFNINRQSWCTLSSIVYKVFICHIQKKVKKVYKVLITRFILIELITSDRLIKQNLKLIKKRDDLHDE